jgi:Uma2 family endonuclease
MQGALKQSYTSEADYLAAEQRSPEKHEYAAGQVFAMSGASIRHNQIVGGIYASLRAHAGACRVTFSDVKFKAHQLYYYPDLMVCCAPQLDEYCETQPCLIVEVLSESTEKIDRGEKLHNYQKVPELETYLRVSQQERRVDVYQRDGAFWRFRSLTDDAAIELSCPAMRLTLEAIDRGVAFDAQEPVRSSGA